MSNLYSEWQLNTCELFASGIFHSIFRLWLVMGDGDCSTKPQTEGLLHYFSQLPLWQYATMWFMLLEWPCPLYQKFMIQRRSQVWQWQQLQKKPHVPRGLMCKLQGPGLRGSQGWTHDLRLVSGWESEPGSSDLKTTGGSISVLKGFLLIKNPKSYSFLSIISHPTLMKLHSTFP